VDEGILVSLKALLHQGYDQYPTNPRRMKKNIYYRIFDLDQ